ncbi:MAG: sigma-E factor negative regulatory protein [Burkholderiales bacterium]|nr:sigma-E factor negative regulatory protein [Burkholderiales bacterium]
MKKERISELMDGELDGLQADLLLRRMNDGDARASWEAYHLIGDVLRGDLGCQVSGRVSARLAAEPTVLAPRPLAGVQTRGLGMSIAASVAAVAVVGYLAMNTSAEGGRYDTLQQAQATPAGASPVEDYLALHHGEVRNVAFEPAYSTESSR